MMARVFIMIEFRPRQLQRQIQRQTRSKQQLAPRHCFLQQYHHMDRLNDQHAVCMLAST